MTKKKLTKYTLVGVSCTLFSMLSYPLVIKYINENNISAYIIATIFNITVSYIMQSIISFELFPSYLRFFRYIYISIGIILLGNFFYFLILWYSNDGIIAYYISWVITSLISYLTHYYYTFRN